MKCWLVCTAMRRFISWLEYKFLMNRPLLVVQLHLAVITNQPSKANTLIRLYVVATQITNAHIPMIELT